MTRFGHRALSEGDLSQPRWSEDPQPVQQAVAACLALGVTTLAPVATGNGEQALLAAVDGKQRKEAQRLLQQLRVLLPSQSRALNAYAYVLAGTRRWALGAGQEAMSDQRLLAVDDVFVYELEEVKEMMTGEWNVSDRAGIHATAAERRAQLAAWQAAAASPLLVGDQPGWCCTFRAAWRARPRRRAGPAATHTSGCPWGKPSALCGCWQSQFWLASSRTVVGRSGCPWQPASPSPRVRYWIQPYLLLGRWACRL